MLFLLFDENLFHFFFFDFATINIIFHFHIKKLFFRLRHLINWFLRLGRGLTAFKHKFCLSWIHNLWLNEGRSVFYLRGSALNLCGNCIIDIGWWWWICNKIQLIILRRLNDLFLLKIFHFYILFFYAFTRLR
jgi:hypothetical protein